MKKTLLIILFPLLSIGQTQIGADIDGKFSTLYANNYGIGSNVSFCINFLLSGDGNVLAIGDWATGSVFLYKKIDGNWTEIGNDILKSDGRLDNRGSSVSLSYDGTILAVSSPQSATGYYSGYVDIYEYAAGTWKKKSTIEGNYTGGNFGEAVSLSNDGTILAIGAPETEYKTGYVRVYQNIAGIWTKIGADINGKTSYDYFGAELSLSSDGTILAIRSDKNKGALSDNYIQVYKYLAGNWTLLGNDITGNNFSLTLSADGLTVAAGSNLEKDYRVIPSVNVYRLIDNKWTKIGTSLTTTIKYEKMGMSNLISLSGDGSILVLGFILNDNTTSVVRIYKNIEGTWTQLGLDINGIAPSDNAAGNFSLSRDGNVLAIGSSYNETNKSKGKIRVFDLSGILSSDSFVLANFSVYPNPASSMVTITLQEGLLLEKVNIYNTLGQLVKTEKKNSIAVNSLTKGSYFFEVVTNKGKATKTIIIK